jgi:hypothetical protein
MDEEEEGGGDDYIEFEDEDIDRIWKRFPAEGIPIQAKKLYSNYHATESIADNCSWFVAILFFAMHRTEQRWSSGHGNLFSTSLKYE